MSNFSDDVEISFPCPQCGKQTKGSIGWLNAQTEFACAGCNNVVNLDAGEFRDEIRKAETAIKDLRETLGRQR